MSKIGDFVSKHSKLETSHFPAVFVVAVLVGALLVGAGLPGGSASINAGQNVAPSVQTLGVQITKQTPKSSYDPSSNPVDPSQTPTPSTPPIVLGETTPPTASPLPTPTPIPPTPPAPPTKPPSCTPPKAGKYPLCYWPPCNPCVDSNIACPLNNTDQFDYPCYHCERYYSQSMPCRAPIENQ